MEAEFAAEKAREVAHELPKVDVPAVLPGCGKWSSEQREPRRVDGWEWISGFNWNHHVHLWLEFGCECHHVGQVVSGWGKQSSEQGVLVFALQVDGGAEGEGGENATGGGKGEMS